MSLDSIGSILSVLIALFALIMTLIKQPHEIASVDAGILASYSKTLGESAEELRKSRSERAQMIDEFDKKISDMRSEHEALITELKEQHSAQIAALNKEKDERIDQIECDSAKQINNLTLQISTMQSQIATLLQSKDDLDQWAHQLADQVISLNGTPIPFTQTKGG